MKPVGFIPREIKVAQEEKYAPSVLLDWETPTCALDSVKH
jgi:hypothetical protein